MKVIFKATRLVKIIRGEGTAKKKRGTRTEPSGIPTCSTGTRGEN